jgi:hypothetical protein
MNNKEVENMTNLIPNMQRCFSELEEIFLVMIGPNLALID